MPPPQTVADLYDLVRKSQLVEPAKLDAFAVTAGELATPAAVCRRLEADGYLTPFHTAQLLRGKHKGFFLGRYKILDRIGLGGMGQVFLAEHGTMNRRAALKVLPPEKADNVFSRERFLREARAAGQLDHPNLVRAFDFDQDGEIIFLVMEFVDGVSLHDLVARVGPLAPARVAHYLWQVASGLGYLHAFGLVHRDIKPANLLVDRQGVVKILDLGLVRSEVDGDNLTQGEGVKIMGTADFLAPEQALDCSAVDVRADVYSLGATAYYLLTGRPPFTGEKIAQKLIAHQMTTAVPIDHLRGDMPPGLSEVVSKMLAKKPADRFQNPTELMAALEPWAVEIPAPPNEEEIPVAVGAFGNPSSVNLSGPRSGSGRGGSSVSLAGSSSAIRYHASLANEPAPVPTPPPKPAKQADPSRPPELPAAATHGQGKGGVTGSAPAWVSPWAVGAKPAAEAPRPVAAGHAKGFARSVAVGFALAVLLGGAAWGAVALTKGGTPAAAAQGGR